MKNTKNMKKMKNKTNRVVFFHEACLLFVLSVFAAGCLSSAEEKFEMEHDVDPETELKVETLNGRINVSVGQEGKVGVRGVKTVRAMSGARRLVDEINIKVEKKDGLIHVEAEHPRNTMTKQYGASFNIEVPRNTPVNLVAGNGRIEVSGVSGRVLIEGRNGSIRVVDITGDVEVRTRNGAVDISGKMGNILAETSNGRIKVDTYGAPVIEREREIRQQGTAVDEKNDNRTQSGEPGGEKAPADGDERGDGDGEPDGERQDDETDDGQETVDKKNDIDEETPDSDVMPEKETMEPVRRAAGSNVVLSSKNGSIKLQGNLASFRVTSRNGSIRIGAEDGSSLVKDSRASTRNGSIELFVPRNFSCELTADTRNGKIKTDLPVERSSRTSVSGKLGEGVHRLSLETRNGSIKIKKR